MPASDPKLQALLELERRGALNPAAAQMLAGYRAQGTSHTTALGPNGALIAVDSQAMELKKDRDTARSTLDLIGRIQPQLDRVRQLYDRDQKGVGIVKSLREYLPSQRNAQFDTATASLAKLMRPATRTPGEGSMSDFESKLAMQDLPNRWGFDGGNQEALNGLQRYLDQSKATYSKRAGLPTPPPAVRRVPKAPATITLDVNGDIIH